MDAEFDARMLYWCQETQRSCIASSSRYAYFVSLITQNEPGTVDVQ
jgi:hypothetical protein